MFETMATEWFTITAMVLPDQSKTSEIT